MQWAQSSKLQFHIIYGRSFWRMLNAKKSLVGMEYVGQMKVASSDSASRSMANARGDGACDPAPRIPSCTWNAKDPADTQHAPIGNWYLDVNGDWPVEWQRPPDLALHRKQAFAVVQHIGMAVVNDPPTERTILLPVPADTDRTITTAFDVWIEEPNTDHEAWPGKDAGTTLIGRLPIGGVGATCCVVASRVRPDMDALPPLDLTADKAKALRAADTLTFPTVAVAHDLRICENYQNVFLLRADYFGVVHEVAIAQTTDHPNLREQHDPAPSPQGAASGRASRCRWGSDASA